MRSDFDYFTLSIYHCCDFKEFTNNVLNKLCYKKDFKKGIISVKPDLLDVTQYFDPLPDNNYEKYSWWCSNRYPDVIFLMSNKKDGLHITTTSFGMDLDCAMTCIRSSHNNLSESSYWFEHYDKVGNQRLVFALKEDRWIFCDLGAPLPFENLDYYKRRVIKKRINFDIITEYLSKMGINIWDIDQDVIQCMTFERTAW